MMIIQRNDANPIQPHNYREINHFIERCEVWRIPFDVRVPSPIIQSHSTSKKIRMIITHLVMSGQITITFRCN
jgi:hypothetical protein